MISEIQLASYCSSDGKDIENYDLAMADTSQTWEIHHRRGEFTSREDLIKKRLYYGRPSEELIFLTRSEHQKLHKKGKKRKPFTAEHCENLSKSRMGSKNPFYGKTHSDDTKEQISKSLKKHHDITVSQVDDPKAYMRELYLKNKDKIKARYHKKKALAAK